METIENLAFSLLRTKSAKITWDYDEEADVLYLSMGEPRPAVGIDIGEGLILRYDENHQEIVGLTIICLKRRLLQELIPFNKETPALIKNLGIGTPVYA